MSFPRYPEYKDSGVEWLGKVPAHWKTVPLKAVATHNDDVLDESTAPDTEIAYVDISNVDCINGIKTKEDMPFAAAPSRARRRVKHGDVIVSTVRTYLKAIARIRDPEANLVVSTGFAVIRPRGDLEPDFLGHLVSAGFFVDQVIARSTGVSYPAINASELVAIPVPIPPLPEQTQITAFLDRETAKIDALVAEQRRLMELLKEKRQAVISHAVTRGLNPNAPMKPSGIEWLGDVPEHWAVLPIKRIVSVPITDGPHETPNFIDEGVPFVSAEAVSSGVINFSKVRACISEEDNARYSLKYAPKLHDIYMVKSGATTGVTAMVEDRTDFNIWSPLAAIRCNDGSVPHFVLNFMRSKNFQEAVTLNWSFGTQQNIGMGVIENLACTVPPVAEQIAIAEMLKSESAKFDTLTAEAQRAIDLLQERRTALISAAVAGQIDVRTLSEVS
jgi:type I restriction enzyme S subunit